MTIKNHRCDQLGVCQGLGPDQCPDCDSFECEVPVPRRCSPCRWSPDCDHWERDVDAPRLQPVPDRRQADRDRRYPFAPGVIEGSLPTRPFADVDEWLPLSLAETLKLAAVTLVLGLAAGYLVERFV